MLEKIKYQVECDECEAKFDLMSTNEDVLSCDEMPTYCPYCGARLDELSIEEADG